MRVPSIPRQIRSEKPKLLPRGDYVAVIEGIDEPVALKTAAYMFRVPFFLRVEGQILYTQYVGYPPTATMIYRNRHVWLGMSVKVKVKVFTHVFNEYPFNTVDIEWEQV